MNTYLLLRWILISYRAFIKLINGGNVARYENLRKLCQENMTITISKKIIGGLRVKLED